MGSRLAGMVLTAATAGGGALALPGLAATSPDPAVHAAQLAYQAGIHDRQTLAVAVAVCLAESGCTNGRVSPPNRDGSRDRGIWQVNDVHAGQYDMTAVQNDPQANAQAMYGISGGGANWQPWTTYNSGAYLSHLDEGRAAADEVLGHAANLGPEYDGLQPAFAQRLAALIGDAPGRITITSGYRDPQLQAELWQEALAKYGSADAARQWVAPSDGSTCSSNHCQGIAADLGFDSAAIEAWAHAQAAEHGLVFPMSWEDWHVELDPTVATTSQPPAGQQPAQKPTLGNRLDEVYQDLGGGLDSMCAKVDAPDRPELTAACQTLQRAYYGDQGYVTPTGPGGGVYTPPPNPRP